MQVRPPSVTAGKSRSYFSGRFAGSLSEALTAFKNHKINLTWIESFPLRGPETGYLFFLDFEGHTKEARIKKALAMLESKAIRMEVLGSYPRSEPAG